MSSGIATQVDLRQLLASARLPALPRAAIRVMELSRDGNNGPAELAAPIEADPGLTSQVLRFLNSSYFGFTHEIANVKLAITMVGVRTIRNFILWSAVFSAIPDPRCGPLSLKSLWQDSLRRGLFARLTARLAGCRDVEEAFVAALLQDMAVPILAKALPSDYCELLRLRSTSEQRLSQLELERFGWNHAQAGAMIARHWRMPESLAIAIEGHASSGTSRGDATTKAQARVVSLSALVPSCVESAWHESRQFSLAFSQMALPGGTSQTELFRRTDAEVAELAPVLKLERPKRSLVDYYQQAALAR